MVEDELVEALVDQRKGLTETLGRPPFVFVFWMSAAAFGSLPVALRQGANKLSHLGPHP